MKKRFLYHDLAQSIDNFVAKMPNFSLSNEQIEEMLLFELRFSFGLTLLIKKS